VSESYDAIVVGGRCAGSTAALGLARAGWSVLVIDRDEAGSDTLSTNGLWPNTLARLDRLGALEKMRSKHELREVEHRFRVFETELIGGWEPIDGFSKSIAPRRSVLDSALAELASEAGAEMRFGQKVSGVLGAGTAADPVRGVLTSEGEEIEAPWVIGADGRASTVASSLGLPKRGELRGEMAMLFAYWRGLPDSPYMNMHAERHGVLTWGVCEDGVQLVIFNCPPEAATGGARAREAAYLEGIGSFPATLDPATIPAAERVSPLYAAPESMLRGFYRPAAGPGWALAGDACHFKHPASAQGIADAIEHGVRLAECLAGEDPGLETYEAWRDERGVEHYEWSFEFARFPTDAARVLWARVAEEPEAAQDFRGTLSRQVRPRSEFLTPERLGRWFGKMAA
jgi:2-polyprenyl-6-methoxyphenol hydroxylase-like FAD-dependent oxidoreductase